MLKTKNLKVGDTVWVADIVFGKSHKSLRYHTVPTEGVVKDILERSYEGGSNIYVFNKKTGKHLHTSFKYEINDSRDYEDCCLFKTRDEAVEEYNRVIYNEIDLLQSLIDYNKKRLIE